MIDQNKINYTKPDLEKINSKSILLDSEKPKEERRWSFSFFYNIFNKSFKINFKWRF